MYYEAKKDEKTPNIHAKDIEQFISSAKRFGGYYIGRYEARQGEDNSVREKSSYKVYYNLSQIQEANLAQEMYQKSEDGFESDLMNSFAYMTAVVYAQEFDNRIDQNTKFSQIVGYNDENMSSFGTNNDVICNINDMSGNFGEYVTETSNQGDYKCTRIGGFGSNKEFNTVKRSGTKVADVISGMSFRPILYITLN